MATSKAQLKAINEAIKDSKFDEAIEKSREFLAKDSKNYQGYIFLGFALDKKQDYENSEKTYRAAVEAKPQEAQAWQGLVRIYEKQDDLYKSQDVVNKFTDYVRTNGDRLEYADALWITLPESPIYPLLEGRLPHPSQTYERVAGILEDFEKKKINTLIGERRTRLGAKLSEVTLEVKREVYAQSRLEHIYRQLINWTSDDDIRRQYEEKLLFYCYERLLCTPPGELKDQERQKVFGLARDMVAIDHPYKLAWDITVDWQDHKEVSQYDPAVLRSYRQHFPESDLYKVITAYLTSTISPFGPLDGEKDEKDERKSSISKASDDSEDDDEGGVATYIVPLTDEDRMTMLTEGVTLLTSPFGYRLAGQMFLHHGEYETTVEFMRKAKTFLSQEKPKTGLSSTNTEDSYNLSLGTALVYYQSPRHHTEAKSLFDKVLEHDSSSTQAMIGVGLIYEEEEEYDQAIDFLSRALKRDDANVRIRSEAAWVKALKGDWQAAKDELQRCIELIGTKTPPKQLLADTQYRLGSCIWNLDSSRQARKQRGANSAYALWLAALKNSLNHAPTYTSLGIYYADYSKDKKRARRCFQKALELSSAEVMAAERLARSFADDGDWDRVELVAQRVVDSGKVKPPPGSKRKGINWPFAALGVAELNKQDFHKAIVSFQSALRLAPNDYHSWVGLGESYHSSGRYVAATKAIMNAQKLEEDSESDVSGDTWFTKYMLANIKRELGEYDESIDLYEAVMKTHPEEEGVTIAFLQTMVENALSSVEKGLFGKAIQLAKDAIEFAGKTEGSVQETFNFWKSLGDACSVFVSVQSRLDEIPSDCVQRLVGLVAKEASDLYATYDKVTIGIKNDGAQFEEGLTHCLHAMIYFFKQAIHVSSVDRYAQAVGYYNLGWAEHQAHTCLPGNLSKKASGYSKTSIRAFKRAIELEAGNSEFWNALGVVTCYTNPEISQHAFIRSLYLNERSPAAWTNMGALALLSGDTKLANEAFTRAQSTDPDYAHAWLGQGFVALMCGDGKEARGLFTHAMEIAEASSVPTRQHYSISMFDHILAAPAGLSIASLVQPLFALNQLCSLRPHDLAFAHLATMFQERTRESGRAVEISEKICSRLEADYEKTESAESLAQFMLARTDLARAYLADGDYEKANECGSMALELSSDEGDNELPREQRSKARLSAHLTVGLAKYYLKSFDEALASFEAALKESDQNPDATCLLAQVLWAQGTDDARERARSILFEVIETHPGHVQSVLLLGVVALLDDDEDSIEAVVEELQGLRTNDKLTASEQSHIGEVLRTIAAVSGKKEDMTNQVQNDIMLYPHLPHGWSSLAETAGDEQAAQMALKVATRGIPPRGVLGGEDVSRAYSGTGRAGDAQRAVLLAPWEKNGWGALSIATEGI
ncbi:Superkiller protein-like protein [Emericellopsis cladophorae]|uniref:Superkiller protein-like protein n=1 Tax=Emericellopsis cladophorae TaxID=2686198 RepID=A0A9Q0BDA1_9HYPO|nr:Superkiller protein-like protein [Emericellopsis cladophorae]KAI6779974.1 Superkiller protein-like protein [Emericellopsis cladophorae]